MAKKLQSKHHGLTNGMTRKGAVVTTSEGEIKHFTTKRKTFMPKGVDALPAGSPSISRAKRFMRTGSAD